MLEADDLKEQKAKRTTVRPQVTITMAMAYAFSKTLASVVLVYVPVKQF